MGKKNYSEEKMIIQPIIMKAHFVHLTKGQPESHTSHVFSSPDNTRNRPGDPRGSTYGTIPKVDPSQDCIKMEKITKTNITMPRELLWAKAKTISTSMSKQMP